MPPPGSRTSGRPSRGPAPGRRHRRTPGRRTRPSPWVRLSTWPTSTTAPRRRRGRTEAVPAGPAHVGGDVQRAVRLHPDRIDGHGQPDRRGWPPGPGAAGSVPDLDRPIDADRRRRRRPGAGSPSEPGGRHPARSRWSGSRSREPTEVGSRGASWRDTASWRATPVRTARQAASPTQSRRRATTSTPSPSGGWSADDGRRSRHPARPPRARRDRRSTPNRCARRRVRRHRRPHRSATSRVR